MLADWCGSGKNCSDKKNCSFEFEIFEIWKIVKGDRARVAASLYESTFNRRKKKAIRFLFGLDFKEKLG